MEESEIQEIVYSKNSIEFVTVANEFCLFLESLSKNTPPIFISKIQKILPLLYIKASLLPEIESTFEDANEKFVTEHDWYKIHDSIKTLLGNADEFIEVFDPRMQESEMPVVSTISENIADIYQDIKDFILLYRIGTIEIMNDALWECRENFINIWGQKLTNVLRAVHNVAYNYNFEEEENKVNKMVSDHGQNTDDWIISKKQRDYTEE